MKGFFHREWTMAERVLLIAVSVLFGMVIGFGFSPIKAGVQIGNNNGNTDIVKGEDAEE